jgi:hypothetical protein
MPSINISWQRSAGDSNYIYGMPGGTIGPNSGSRSVNVGFGQTYNLSSSGSGPGNTALRRLNMSVVVVLSLATVHFLDHLQLMVVWIPML